MYQPAELKTHPLQQLFECRLGRLCSLVLELLVHRLGLAVGTLGTGQSAAANAHHLSDLGPPSVPWTRT